MRGRTGSEVVGDIRRLLDASGLKATLSGGIYRGGMRPRDSRKEDLVIIFTAGTHGDVDEGVVTLNLYVPDVELGGVMVANGQRCEELERMLYEWASGLSTASTPYLFRMRRAISTHAEEEIHQHFVSLKLGYRYFA